MGVRLPGKDSGQRRRILFPHLPQHSEYEGGVTPTMVIHK